MKTPQGIPVKIDGIEKALGALWEESRETKTRASLINLAIYTEEDEAVERDTALIAELAGEHALRALLILADPKASESKAEAWINAHCYARGNKGQQVCSEQITFRLSGAAVDALPGIVFSHLDSDLPLIFWRQGEFRAPVDRKFWSLVDRLIFDSRDWVHLREQFSLVREIGTRSEPRTVLCDLNWARALALRKTLAGLFDHVAALPELWRLSSVEIDHCPRHRTTALLLLGWLANQLGWHLTLGGRELQFQDARGKVVTVRLQEVAGASISRITMKSAEGVFQLTREHDVDFFVTEMSCKSFSRAKRMVRAPHERLEEILLGELARGGRHLLYDKAVTAIEPLLD